ncbi:MAG TPA: type VI secretion system ATPase TssH [Sphingomonas sp.]|jgi:type VI secretion system protein VasG|uniref:type VI secretion system ATPase TssH n=1 Tax=Sphingomonas sp. TaxID=28214 RepID=UPI002ED91E45
MNLKTLIGRLDPAARTALESAVALAMGRTHYDVEVEHWLLKLAERTSGPVPTILARFDIDPGRLADQLTATLDRFKTGNGRPPALSPRIVRLVREAWLFASVEQEAGNVSPGHLLVALLADRDLSALARDAAPLLGRINAEILSTQFAEIADPSDPATAPASAGGEPAAPPSSTGGKALDTYCIDLTARARAGAIDPVLGRDAEIRQIIDILTRRRQNNPILTGEAGVGKTAVVEGFALRIVAGDVPPALQNVRLLSLDMGLLQAGAGVRGEFENRLKSVIAEAKASPTPLVMFIDEAHSLVGAGGSEGQGDAANLLKPALARGELRTVAATTWAEYKKYFEKDAALSRRFQVVKIEEPDETAAIGMMRGLVATLEGHHGVRILNEAVEACVRLSHRYIFDRQLPDKAISLLDTACARVAMSQAATPPALEDASRRVDALAVERDILLRESAGGIDHAARLDTIAADQAAMVDEIARLNARWQAERDLVAVLKADRIALGSEASDEAARVAMQERTATNIAALETLQGERPMVFDQVDRNAVADVVALWTGIPVGRMVADEIRDVLNLESLMARRIRGQDQALAAIGSAMRASRAGLTDPRKPTGVFLMVGVSGVGKTETALTLADLFYGGANNMTVINMSEFKEEHKVSMLLGAPPGYVGYGEGGVLTEAVRRKPFGVVLLDEMEKAHPGVQDVFYQLFDKGRIKDGQGRDIDFRNTMLIMTSNAGSDMIEKLCADPETMPDAAGLAAALRPALLNHFRPAFLGRVTVVPYFPLTSDIILEIIGLALNRVADRIRASYGATLGWSDAVVDLLASRCTETQSGARNVEAVIANGIIPDLSAMILQQRQDNATHNHVEIVVDASGGLKYNWAVA